VLQVIGQSKNNCVSKADVGDLIEDSPGFAVPDLENSPRIDLSTQIDAHCNQSPVSHIIMPIVMVVVTGDQTIHSSLKASNLLIPRDSPDHLEQLLTVRQEIQEMGALAVLVHAKLFVGPNPFVDPFIEVGFIDHLLDFRQKSSLQKAG
jgi:hypothetical protein